MQVLRSCGIRQVRKPIGVIGETFIQQEPVQLKDFNFYGQTSTVRSKPVRSISSVGSLYTYKGYPQLYWNEERKGHPNIVRSSTVSRGNRQANVLLNHLALLYSNKPRFLHHSSGDNQNKNKKTTQEEMSFQIRKATNISDSKTLVAVFGHYGITPKGAASYCEVYQDYGADVMYVHTKLSHFAWPRSCVSLARYFLAQLNASCSSYENIVIHAMSIGAYSFTIVMDEMDKSPEKYGTIKSKICAVVYDSITMGTLKNMAVGIGKGATKNQALQRAIPVAMLTYLYSTYPFTVREFNYYIQLFKQRPLEIPTLMMFAYNDPMMEMEDFEQMMKDWKRRGSFPIVVRGWRDSRHAANLKFHKDEYIKTVDKFLNDVPQLSSCRIDSSKL